MGSLGFCLLRILAAAIKSLFSESWSRLRVRRFWILLGDGRENSVEVCFWIFLRDFFLFLILNGALLLSNEESKEEDLRRVSSLEIR